MPTINCKNCGGIVSPDADKCPHCGTPNFSDGKLILGYFQLACHLAGLGLLFYLGWLCYKFFYLV